MHKIYIHHRYTDTLFLKLAHNTTNREIVAVEDVTTVRFQYGDTQFEFVFDKRVNNNSDGWHLIDYFAALYQKEEDPKFYWESDDDDQTIPVLEKMNEVLRGKKGWIITCFRTEKLFSKYDVTADDKKSIKVEDEIEKMNQNFVITDNYFLNPLIENKYPYAFFTLSNTIFQWNEMMSIRWYYEFRQIFKNLNFEYDLMYSIRSHKWNRINILYELKKLENPKILLQRTNSHNMKKEYQKYQFFSSELVRNIPLNNIYGEKDFDDLTKLKNWYYGIGYDLFFRVLSKAKMQVLCESWSFSKTEPVAQYLSEKTYGLILAEIPFISTHYYPLEIIEKILNVKPHPFYLETKQIRNEKDFANFVNEFMKDFENNHKLCKDWVELCHQKMVSHIETKNDFLELIINGFQKESIVVSKSII